MKVYITGGHHRGRIGTINGDLTDRLTHCTGIGIERVFVKFAPTADRRGNVSGAPVVSVIMLRFLRELTEMERLLYDE